MKKTRKKYFIPTWVYACCGLSFLFSFTALLLSNAALDYPVFKLVLSSEKALSVFGITFAVISFAVTSYCTIAIAISQNQVKNIKDDAFAIIEYLDDSMQSQYKETLNLMDSLEGIIPDGKKYIRISIARFIIGSKYSTDEEKERGITYLHESKAKDDYDLLKDRIVNNSEITNVQLKEKAKAAMKAINPE